MAIAWQDSQYGSVASYTVNTTKPTGTAENSILLLAAIGQTDAGAAPTITQPSGFAEICTYKIETARTWGLYWKRAGASEPANYTTSIPNVGICYISTMLSAFNGFTVHTGNPFDQYTNYDYQTSDMYMYGGGFTPTRSPSLAFYLGHSRSGYYSSATPASGWTERMDHGGSHFQYLMEKALSDLSTVANVTPTLSGSADTRKHAFLINLADPVVASGRILKPQRGII